jgi:hypothetical protein
MPQGSGSSSSGSSFLQIASCPSRSKSSSICCSSSSSSSSSIYLSSFVGREL